MEDAIKTGVNETAAAGLTRSASAMILESLESAVTKALSIPSALPLGVPVMSEGWELIFARDLINPTARALIHAVPKAIGL